MNKIDKVFNIMEENAMSGEEVLQLFIHYYGNQIITEDFFKFIEEEGYYVPEE